MRRLATLVLALLLLAPAAAHARVARSIAVTERPAAT